MLRLALVIALVTFSLPALAQNSGSTLQAISDFNRIHPEQNPEYTTGEKVLDRHVLDRKNHVVGEINDVVFRSNGGLKSLQIDFDRLRLDQPVYVNYHALNIKTGGNTYQLGLEDKEIGSLYPQLLSDIETASGPGTDDLSMKRTVGAAVNTQDGRAVGTVDDVLFSAEGDRVEALYVKISNGAQAGKKVAVPLDQVTLADDGAKISGTVSGDVADSIIAVAGGK